MRLIAFCALALLVGQPVAAQPRHGGVFAYDHYTCGATYTTTRAVRAYAQPQATGTPVRRIAAGRRIEDIERDGDRSDLFVVVLAPGRLVARRNVTVDEWGYYDSEREARGPLRIPRGTAIEVLGLVGENSTLWRMGGVVYASDSVPSNRTSYAQYFTADFTARSWPRSEWWVPLASGGGRPAAWVKVSGPGVRAEYADVGEC